MNIDTGDTAWILVSAALVMLMTPGLAFFYGGMMHAESVLNMMMSIGTIGTVGCCGCWSGTEWRGLVGTLLIGLLASSAAPAGVDGLFYGDGFDQLWRQAVGAFVVSFVATWIIGFAPQKTIGFRVARDSEWPVSTRSSAPRRPTTFSPTAASAPPGVAVWGVEESVFQPRPDRHDILHDGASAG